MHIMKFWILAVAALAHCATVLGQSPDQAWPFYGCNAGGERYAGLQQINDRNVSHLKLAWVYRTGELKTYEGTGASEKAAFEATPIMIGGILYFSTPSDRVIAVGAMDGKEKWVFDPHVDLHGDFSEVSSRGVASWPAGKSPKRIFIG
ncbi:MAG TPA: hypothetical protein VHC96_18275, partial [Puia sp.]|nr:hypothetical protein [Puia sp.]